MIKTLIVEDNHDFRASLKAMLSSHYPDMPIAEAGNAAEALDQYDQFCPDVALVDISLPGRMNGLELIARIRRDDPRIRMIVITNHDLPEYRAASIQLGADYFLPKAAPTTSAEILALMNSFMTVFEGATGR